MRRLYCHCGQEVIFEDRQCPSCGSELGFDPETFRMLSIKILDNKTWLDQDRNRVKVCSLRRNAIHCNWLVAAGDKHSQCRSCRLTRHIPSQSIAINVKHWGILEQAKRRLIYSLLWMSMPIIDRRQNPEEGLAFDFLEDQRTNPRVQPKIVYTGHHNGVITVNVMEADEMARVSMRQQFNERYRTVLGHLRHEMGHYYWQTLIQDTDWYPRFRRLFGDESNYREALDYYYLHGPVPHWEQRYISAYASSHPWEDWAETWAHYLHIMNTLETALSFGAIQPVDTEQDDFHILMQAWRQLALLMNSLNRSMGLADAYPFRPAARVVAKLRFIHQLVMSQSADSA